MSLLRNLGDDAAQSSILMARFSMVRGRVTTDGPPSGPGVTLPAEPPATLPSAWGRAIARAAERIKVLNPGRALTDAEATEIARRRLRLAAADQQGFEICRRRGLPIFVSGADVAEASQHDLEALSTPTGIGWFRLNYRSQAQQLPLSPRNWWGADPRCLDTGGDTGKSCDEFPLFATEQGGRDALPQPSLTAIDKDGNSLQGSRYGTFISVCSMQTGTPGVPGSGAMFLIVPIPQVIPSMSLCNGKGQTP